MSAVVGTCRCTLPPVARQRLDRAGMYRQLARLGELGLPYRQHSALEIDIGIAQMNGFGDAQTGRGHQAEQGLVGGRAQAAAGPELAGCRQQFDDLLITVDVWRHTARFRAEDRLLRHLGIRLELFQVAGEMPQPSPGDAPRCPVLPRAILSCRAQSAMSSAVSGPR